MFGLPGRKTEAGKPVRQSREEVDRRGDAIIGAGCCRFLSRTQVHGTRTGHCAEDFQRDQGAVGVPQQCRVGLSHAGSGGRDAIGGRGAAHPAGHADRLWLGGRPVYIWMSRRSVCTSGTTDGCFRHSSASGIWGIPSSSWNMMRKPCRRPTICSTWDRAPGRRAAISLPKDAERDHGERCFSDRTVFAWRGDGLVAASGAKGQGASLRVGARKHNLKGITARIPLGY